MQTEVIMKRLFALLLALATLMCAAVSCADTGTSEETTAGAASVATTEPIPETESPYDENGYLKDRIPKRSTTAARLLTSFIGTMQRTLNSPPRMTATA